MNSEIVNSEGAAGGGARAHCCWCWQWRVALLVGLAWALSLGGSAWATVTDADVAELRRQADVGVRDYRKNLIEAVHRLTPDDAPARILDVIILFCDYRYAEGGSESALPAAEAAARLAQVIGDHSRLASLEALAGQMQFALHRDHASRARMEQALQAQRSAGNPKEVARQAGAYSALLLDVEDFALAMRLSNEAMEIVGDRPDVKITAATFGVVVGRVDLLRSVGDPASTLRAAEALLARCEASGNADFIATAQHTLARAARTTGDRARAAALLERVYAHAVDWSDPLGQWLATLDRVAIAIDQSEFDLARRWIDRVLPLRASVDDAVLRARLDIADARVAARRGDAGRARIAFQRASALIANTGETWLAANLREAEADVLVAEGKRDQAATVFREAIALKVEAERQFQRRAISAQASLHRLSEREFREKQLEQEAKLRASELDAAEQRVVKQRLLVLLVTLSAAAALAVAVWQLRRAASYRRRADTDSLTGVLSRSAIEAVGQLRFRRARDARRPFAVLLVDVDHLKQVNDQYGHARGDALLQEVARLLRTSLRPDDQLGRWGGDEFVIIPGVADALLAESVATRLCEAVATGLKDAGFASAGRAGCSIGAVVSGGDASAVEGFSTLLGRADAAMYEAKRRGGNQVAFAP